jgi:hypothetical protein
MFRPITSLRSKKVIIFVLLKQSEMINSLGNPYQTKVKYINTLYQSKYDSHSCYNIIYASNLSYCIMLIIIHYAYARSCEARTRKYGGLQASSCEETNISFSLSKRQAPMYLTNISLTFVFNHYLYYNLIVH